MGKIDWYVVISDSLFVVVVGTLLVGATVAMGWWAMVFVSAFAFSMFVNRVESFRLGQLRGRDNGDSSTTA